MLVLTRKEGERVRIGPDTVVTVVRIRPDGRVVLGFESPPKVRIVRTELEAQPRRTPANVDLREGDVVVLRAG